MANPLSKAFSFKKYYNILNGIGKKQEYKLEQNEDYKKKMDLLINWLVKEGMKISKKMEYPAYFKSKEGYLYPGFVAKEKIKANDILLEVPSHLVLSTQTAYYSDLNPFFQQYPGVFSDKNAAWEDYVLIIYLMFEEAKGPKSLWFPMMQLWPKTVDTFYCWKDSEIREIQWKRIVKDAIKENAALRDSWEMLVEELNKHPHLFPKNYFNYTNYIRYWALLGSRIFNSLINTTAFTPYAEFVNHHNACTHYKTLLKEDLDKLKENTNPPADCNDEGCNSDFELDDRYDINMEDLDSNDGAKLNLEVGGNNEFDYENELAALKVLTLTSCKLPENAEAIEKIRVKFAEDKPHIQILKNDDQEYEEDSQIYMTYGDHSNIYLLNKYGFIVENNVFDYALVEFNLIKQYQDYEKIEKALRAHFKKISEAFYDMGIKVYHHRISQKLIQFAKACLGMNPKTFVSFEDEEKVLLECIKLLEDSISEFPTTSDEDNVLLLQESSYKIKMAITARRDYKLILQHQIYLINLVIKINKKLKSQNLDIVMKPKECIKAIVEKLPEETQDDIDVQLSRRMIHHYYEAYGLSLLN